MTSEEAIAFMKEGGDVQASDGRRFRLVGPELRSRAVGAVDFVPSRLRPGEFRSLSFEPVIP